MRLVPGVVVASNVIASIDANGDGVISPDEHTYAQQVLNSILIALDVSLDTRTRATNRSSRQSESEHRVETH